MLTDLVAKFNKELATASAPQFMRCGRRTTWYNPAMRAFDKSQTAAVIKRLRIRFSLRTFLIAVTLVSLGFGFFFNRVQNERRAAKAIAEAHGQIVYDWQIGPEGSDSKLQPTPPGPKWLRERLGPHWFDRIVEVSLNAFSNRDSKNRFAVVGPHLAKLPALRSLSVWGLDLTNDDYRLLGQLSRIKLLRLRLESEIRPRNAAALVNMTGLRELSIGYAKISPAALAELAKVPNLESLSIDCDSYDRLTGRRLVEHQLRDDAAMTMATFPKLRSLSLHQTEISDGGMVALCRLSRLERLTVSSPHITSKSFDHVVRLQRLEGLGTWQWKINDADIEKLARLPRLTSLSLVTRLTDSSVRHLAKLDRIERLTLYGQEITDASVPHLCRLSRLEWLDISDTKIAKHGPGANELRRAFPKCRMNLPQTEREKGMERAFNASKWGVNY